MTEIISPIPSRLKNVAVGGHVAGADQIIDDQLNKDQETINAEVAEALGDGGTVDEKIDDALEDVAFLEDASSSAVIPSFDPQSDSLWKGAQVLSTAEKNQVKANLGLDTDIANIGATITAETSRATAAESTLQNNITSSVNAEKSRAMAAEEQLRQAYQAISDSDIVVGALPAAGSGHINTIYRVPGTNSYSDYMYATEGGTEVLMATYNNAIDAVPTAGSDNLVKSGGVAKLVFSTQEVVSLSMNTGYLVKHSGEKVTAADFSMSSPTDFKRGDVINVECRANNYISVISKYNGLNQYFIPLVRGTGSDSGVWNQNITYVVPEDCSLVFSCAKNPSIVVIKNVLGGYDGSSIAQNNDDLQDLKEDISKEEYTSVTVNVNSGKFINANGILSDYGSGYYTDPVFFKKGEIINAVSTGHSYIAIISKTDVLGTSYIPVVIGTGSTSSATFQYAQYEVEEDGYFAFSSLITNNIEVSKTIKSGLIPSLMPNNVNLDLQVSVTNGHYVNYEGESRPSENGYISNPIPLKAGQEIVASLKANKEVAVISTKYEGDYYYTPLVRGSGSTSSTHSQTVRYKADKDCNIILSTVQDASPSAYIIVRDNVIDKINTVQNELNVVEESISDMHEILCSPSLFENIGFCGDSYTSASIHNGQGTAWTIPQVSWGSILSRLNGVQAHIYAQGGMRTDSFITDQLPNLLNDDPWNLYIFLLGINDYQDGLTLGTIEDITSHQSYEDYPNTFYGNYGKIIERVIAHAPKAKIILMTPFIGKLTGYYNYAKNALVEITEHYGIGFIDTGNSKLANSSFFMDGMVGGHPTTPLHSAMALDINKLIGRCMVEYYDYFKTYYREH